MRRSLSLAALATLLAAGSAHAGECQAVRARLEAATFTDGCKSPVGLCVAGTIQGSDGLGGTLLATVETLVPTAHDGRYAFTETLVVTTARGALTFSSTGIFDAVNGRVSELHEVSGGTGDFTGASGYLFEGTVATGAGTYAGDIQGRLCRAD